MGQNIIAVEGEHGCYDIQDAADHDNLNCSAIYCVTECTFTHLVDLSSDVADLGSATALAQGTFLRGAFKRIQKASAAGWVRAYKAE